MTKNKTKIVVVGIILIAFVATIGISYAIWQMTLQQTNENVITTGCFQIEFQDKNPINLESAYPISNEEGKSLEPYEFTITNTCNSYASYQINLEILDTTTLENLDYLKIMLDDKASLLTDNEVVTKTLANAKTSYKLKTGYLRENQAKTFSLRLWMDEDTPTSEEFMNKLFESKVTVIATYKENLDNNIEVNAVSQNESFSDQETFQIHVTSEFFDLVSISDDLETWEELETKGKDIIIEKTITTNGSHTFYFRDEAENVQEVTVNVTKIDDKKPIANMSVVKENNVIKIDASGSKDHETGISKYYYSNDGINYKESTENKFQFTNDYIYGVATTMLTSFERNQIKKVYLKVEDEIGNISDVKELSITESDFAYDETIDNNLRYIGANPSNYVSFNNELWRIIGVMNNIDDGTGKKATRLKLISNEPIGGYPWDTTVSGINDGFGINEWSQADAMKLMNPGYEILPNNASLYWNGTSGKCFIGQNNLRGDCDFTTNGLKDYSKNFISEVVWNTGSNGTSVEWNNISTLKFYELERSSNTGKICTSGTYCNDTVTRARTWTGYVGLMYPSDYGYATSGGTSTNRENCLKTILYNWNNYNECYKNDWLHDEKNIQWTISPCANSISSDRLFSLSVDGAIRFSSGYYPRSLFPVLYLKSTVKVANGIGTELNPFSLSLE